MKTNYKPDKKNDQKCWKRVQVIKNQNWVDIYKNINCVLELHKIENKIIKRHFLSKIGEKLKDFILCIIWKQSNSTDQKIILIILLML